MSICQVHALIWENKSFFQGLFGYGWLTVVPNILNTNTLALLNCNTHMNSWARNLAKIEILTGAGPKTLWGVKSDLTHRNGEFEMEDWQTQSQKFGVESLPTHLLTLYSSNLSCVLLTFLMKTAVWPRVILRIQGDARCFLLLEANLLKARTLFYRVGTRKLLKLTLRCK